MALVPSNITPFGSPRGGPPATRSICFARWTSRLFFLLLACLGLAGPACQSPSRQRADHPGFARLLDAVVRIDVRSADFGDGSRRYVRGVGSGVIMTAEGHVLTNAHVAGPKAVEISVTLGNLERIDARLVGWDHWTDLALLQLDMKAVREKGWKLAHAEFGDSSLLRIGTVVRAAGTPNGLTRTVTEGIVSNTNRYFAATAGIDGHETGYFNTWLQTDAAINPGNSGGPLATLDGRVVGINTRGYLGANNLGFAVPSATARWVMNSLLRKPAIERSYIGLKPAPLQDLENFFDLKINQGMLVDSVDVGSPADLAGIRAGDIVLAIDGRPVDGRFPEQLPPILNSIALAPVGASLQLDIKRGKETRTAVAATERLESRVGDQSAFEDWGLSVEKVSRAVARENRLESADGVMVMGVLPAFPAAVSGLRAGDIIVRANRRGVTGLADLQACYDEYRAAPGKVLLEVNRQHQAAYLVLKP